MVKTIQIIRQIKLEKNLMKYQEKTISKEK